MGMTVAGNANESPGAASPDRRRKRRYVLVPLCGAVLVCLLTWWWLATWGTRAEHRVDLAIEELTQPSDAVLLHTYEAVESWPRSACPYAFEGRIYGTQWVMEEVVTYYDAMVPALGYRKCTNYPSATFSCYERPDGSGLSVGHPDYTHDEVVEQHRDQFPTAFLVTMSWGEPALEARCREAQCLMADTPSGED
jgi:hypothetical protein